ncbi:MAG TPA: ParB/RepB/Spo0J family partition protein [Nocardioidaceae bacterium]|nr:ParB/RepB/Spo0J family partition protein [Nocardioidaceae bacterium]
MTERLITLPLTSVHAHPDNPRIAAEADDELVDSIRIHGLLEPAMVAPDPALEDVYVLLDGHRRYDGAQRAGLKEATFRVRDDLVTTAQQIEVMVITGLQKQLLSPVEEARAYEQLTLLGMDEKQIAKSSGYSRARVKQRLRLTGLTKEAQTAVHTGEATLVDIEAFHEFAGDPDATAKLEEALGTDDFHLTVIQLRTRRERLEKNAVAVAEFTALGARPRQPHETTRWLTQYMWSETPFAEPATHAEAGCLGYIDYGADSYTEPTMVCLAPATHEDIAVVPGEDPAVAAAREKEAQAERAARDAARDLQDAANEARLSWLYDHFTSLFPIKGNSALALTLAGVLPGMDMNLYQESTLRALEVDVPEEWSAKSAAVSEAKAVLATATPVKVLRAFARLHAAAAADLLADDFGSHRDLDEMTSQLQAWDWLASTNYPMPEVDVVRHQELREVVAEKRGEDQ